MEAPAVVATILKSKAMTFTSCTELFDQSRWSPPPPFPISKVDPALFFHTRVSTPVYSTSRVHVPAAPEALSVQLPLYRVAFPSAAMSTTELLATFNPAKVTVPLPSDMSAVKSINVFNFISS